MGISKLNWHSKIKNLFFSFDHTFPNLINCWNFSESFASLFPLQNVFRIIQKGEINCKFFFYFLFFLLFFFIFYFSEKKKKAAQWHPVHPFIVLASSKESKLYFCSKHSCTAIELPETLQLISIRFSQNGDKLLAIGESQFCVAYFENFNGLFGNEDTFNLESTKFFLNKVL